MRRNQKNPHAMTDLIREVVREEIAHERDRGAKMHGSCQQHGCQWPQGLGAVIVEHDRYREALERIANEDFRGNRPWSATIAEQALRLDGRDT